MSKYCHSNDGELYYGEFDTEQDALEDAKESYPGESEIYIGTCTKPVFRWNGCEEKIIDSIKENLAEDVGEAAENFGVSEEQEQELARMMDRTGRDRAILLLCFGWSYCFFKLNFNGLKRR